MSEARAFRFEQFQDYLTFERGLSDRTVSAYRRDLARWATFLEGRGVAAPDDVTPDHMRAWVASLSDDGLAAASIRRAQSAVRTYFTFLVAEGALETDPTERLESPRMGRKLPEFLTKAEVSRLLEAPDPGAEMFWRDRAILELLYATGMRVERATSRMCQIPPRVTYFEG